MTEEIFIIAAKRTATGKFRGMHKNTPAPHLCGPVIAKLVEETNILPSAVDEVILGNVLSAGIGQAPARQAALHAGLPENCPAATVDKVCSSSLYALTLATSRIKARDAELVIAGGMENMSQAPYLIARTDKRLGHRFLDHSSLGTTATDSMLHDGLIDIYDPALPHMGKLADRCALEQGISRDEQDYFALESHARALAARDIPLFQEQIVPVNGLKFDEGVRKTDAQKMTRLKPFFASDGTVTAANASQISDGAAALMLASSNAAKRIRSIQPLARVVAYAMHSQNPSWYTMAPAGAIELVLGKSGLAVDDIDLFEINEAFAVVPIYTMRELKIPHDKVNIWGGAIAVGHPLGASGARIVVTLLHALRHTGGRYGLAVTCNGGGEAVAMVVENLIR